MKQKMKKVVIGSIMLSLVLLLGLAAWLITRNRAAEETQIAKNLLDVDWYDENGTEFTITTREELFDLVELSYFYDFAGQTIKLGADIVVNEGNAADWQNEQPEYEWESIHGFAGTFDGQGHTISGLYSIGLRYFANIERVEGTDYITASLFRNTQKECVIKNFKIVNSYFESDLDHGVGSVSSNGAGTFDSIYSDVIIRSQKCYVGGIIGNVSDDTTITNCWFDGSIEVFMKYGRYIGGIAGRTTNNAECTIEHCLVTATMTSDVDQRGNQLGGILGQSYQSKATINDCLMTGKVYDGHGIAGSVVGNVAPESTTTLSNVFTCVDSHKIQIGYIEQGKLVGRPIVYDRETITGLGGYQWTTLDFENYWVTVEGGTPVLKTFADNALDLNGVAKNIDTSWYNEQEDTYVLMDQADFYGFALLSNKTNFEGKTIKLGANIKLNEGKASTWKKEAPSNKWICIGTKELPFAGTFDGQMHSIGGVYLKTETAYSGLFGVTTQTATIKRFKLTNSYFESNETGLGSIAGQAIGTFDTIYSDAIVINEKGCIGGMIGRATEKKDSSIKMTNCWFDGTVINTGNSVDYRNTGGLIGYVVIKADLSNCLNTGTIDIRSYKVPNDEKSEHVQPFAGGFIGSINPISKTTITDCMNTGSILMSDAVTSAAGSILGYSSGKTIISNTYAIKESSKFITRGNVDGEVIVYEKAQITGYGAYQWTTLNFNKYWAVVMNDTSVLKSFASKVPSLNGVARKVDISWYDKKADTYVLYDMADLGGFALLSKTTDFKGKTIKLANDIELNNGNADDWRKTAPETEWMGIGSATKRFAGTFDGQMHTVSGVYMNTDSKYTGFFGGTAEEALVKNFRLTNSYFFSTEEEVGSIVGNARGTFDSIYSNAIVECSNNLAGGLIGSTSWDIGVKVKNCWFDGEVTNVQKAGSYYAGILARACRSTTITNCINTGTIRSDMAKQPRAGGIFGGIGRSGTTVDISYCLNAGEIVHGAKTKEQGLLVGSAVGTVNVDNSYSIAQGSNTLVATKADKTYSTCGVSGTVENILGTSALGSAARLFVKQNNEGKYDNRWVAVLGSVPVPKKLLAYTSGEQFTPDVSWYDGSKEYTLTTKEQLYGLAVLSYQSELDGFAGKTIKLGADITINEGNASDWKEVAPEYGWGSIGDSTAKFKGNFDGQKHTISGIYQNTAKQCQGLFGDVLGDVLIANFSLENSYFNYHGTNGNAFLGAVAGRATGRFKNIYVNAIVESTGKRTAGIVGSTSTSGALAITNCWNAGPVSGTNTHIGSMIGYVDKAPTIKNCLNTGTISSTYTETNATKKFSLAIGGFLGNSVYGTGLYNCLHLGTLSYIKTDYSTDYGTMVGSLAGGTTFQDLFTIKQDGVADFGGIGMSNNVTKINSLDDIKGTDALINMTKLFTTQTSDGNYESYWSVVPNGVPVLTSFAKYVGEEHLAIDTSWYDGSKIYELEDASDLYGLAALSYRVELNGFANETFKLVKDITINQNMDAPKYGWLCIGGVGSPTPRFAGTFDGKDSKGNIHKISGLHINTSSKYTGLFSGTATTAKVQNIRLMDSYIYSSADEVGSIVGNAQGKFHTIYSDAIVESSAPYVGGMIGSTSYGAGITMENCWFAGEVTNVIKTNNYYGGLVGRIYNDSTIKNCLNTGTVSLTGSYTPRVGGLIGLVDNRSLVLNMSNCFNAKELVLKNPVQTYYGLLIGGIGGAKPTLNLTDCYSISQKVNDYDVPGTPQNVALVYDKADSSFTSCKTVGAADAIKGTDALDKMPNLFATKGSDNKYESYWAVVPNGTPILESFAKFETEKSLAVDASWYDGSKTYELEDESDLYGLAVLSRRVDLNGFANETFKVVKDITINQNIDEPDYEWISIGGVGSPTPRFAGTFDGMDSKGNIHTISGVYMNTNSKYTGLFGGTAAAAKIQNLRLTNSNYYSTAEEVGSIVGNAMGRFDTIYSDAIVTCANNLVGGLIGSTSSGGGITMSNCWFHGKVENVNKAASYYGGLVGRIYNISTISNCLNTGKVYCEMAGTPCVGGLVGTIMGGSLEIRNSLNTGEIRHKNGTTAQGLFVGHMSKTITLENSYSISQGSLTLVVGKTDATYPSCASIGPKTELTTENASEKLPKLFDAQFTDKWVTGSNDTPVVLKSFKDIVRKLK